MATTNTVSTSAFTKITGSIPTGKSGSPAIIALYNNQVVSLDNTAPGTQWRSSSSVPGAVGVPAGITGDYTNGVVVYSGANVAYLTGVGVPGANWNILPSPFDSDGSSAIQGITGDLINGIVVYSGRNLYSLVLNGATPEWNLMTVAPGTVTAIAGDPTNGVLIAVDPSGTGTGPSSLYSGQGGCLCQWAPLTGQGLPVAKVKIDFLSGNFTNNFIFYGENQLFSLTVKSGAGTQAKLSALPFQVKALCGAAANGILAIAGSGDLIVSNADSSAASWTVVTVKSAPHSSSKVGQLASNESAAVSVA
ncbi:MAG: hypothetical protein KGM99_02925 [Burkholderiales bacterium]|nr:hypothetical protein [Burkholderiales bacterium]